MDIIISLGYSGPLFLKQTHQSVNLGILLAAFLTQASLRVQKPLDWFLTLLIVPIIIYWKVKLSQWFTMSTWHFHKHLKGSNHRQWLTQILRLTLWSKHRSEKKNLIFKMAHKLSSVCNSDYIVLSSCGLGETPVSTTNRTLWQPCLCTFIWMFVTYQDQVAQVAFQWVLKYLVHWADPLWKRWKLSEMSQSFTRRN